MWFRRKCELKNRLLWFISDVSVVFKKKRINKFVVHHVRTLVLNVLSKYFTHKRGYGWIVTLQADNSMCVKLIVYWSFSSSGCPQSTGISPSLRKEMKTMNSKISAGFLQRNLQLRFLLLDESFHVIKVIRVIKMIFQVYYASSNIFIHTVFIASHTFIT